VDPIVVATRELDPKVAGLERWDGDLGRENDLLIYSFLSLSATRRVMSKPPCWRSAISPPSQLVFLK
jgi:hypothetical protein